MSADGNWKPESSLLKLATQMPVLPKRPRKSDLHIVDWPTVNLCAAVVLLLIAACFLRWFSH